MPGIKHKSDGAEYAILPVHTVGNILQTHVSNTHSDEKEYENNDRE